MVFFGPRLGSKTEHFRIPDDLPPGPMQEFLPLRILRVGTLPRFAPQPVRWNGELYAAETWVEQVASDLEPVARFEDGRGALFRHDRFFYLAGLPDDRWLRDLVKMAVTEQELPIVNLPEGVRSRRLGLLRCFFNYNPYPVQLSPGEGFETLIGDINLPPAGVLIGRERDPIPI
jgi:beta-galactosidase